MMAQGRIRRSFPEGWTNIILKSSLRHKEEKALISMWSSSAQHKNIIFYISIYNKWLLRSI